MTRFQQASLAVLAAGLLVGAAPGRPAAQPARPAPRAAAQPAPKRTQQVYLVGRGDTLPAIATALGVTVAELRRWNGLKSDHVSPGRRLKYFGAPARAESVGRPSGGSLRNGTRLPFDGKGYTMSRERTRVFGTPETVRYVKDCMGRYRNQYKKGPAVNIGDLSSHDGGPAEPHVSHQSGRDVDIGFLTRPPQSPGRFDREATGESSLDVDKQWFLVKCFLDNTPVGAIFMDWGVVNALKAHVEKIYKKNAGMRLKYLRRFPSSVSGTLKADSDHRTHMHVRFKCPRGNRRCVE